MPFTCFIVDAAAYLKTVNQQDYHHQNLRQKKVLTCFETVVP